MIFGSRIVATIGIALLASTALAQAAPMTVTASLSSSAETLANKSDGTGTLTGSYDPATMMLALTVSYKDLTGPATMAHFHAPAPTGKDAPVEIPIKGAITSPIKVDMKLTEAQAKNMTDGMTYFNIHTAANPKGEIRGQVLVK